MVDIDLAQLIVEKHWKQCPECGRVVEKIDGCNSMFCYCDAAFCYECGKLLWDDKDVCVCSDPQSESDA